jgi:mannose/fructose/N-acetylgalactosamine-specific phosphotransferase system component IID
MREFFRMCMSGSWNVEQLSVQGALFSFKPVINGTPSADPDRSHIRALHNVHRSIPAQPYMGHNMVLCLDMLKREDDKQRKKNSACSVRSAAS